MKLLVFGGSFNPPHYGHAQLIEFLLQREQPDLLLVLPVSRAPHKNELDLLPFTARLYLVRLQLRPLLHKHHNLKVSRLENRLPAPNYTLRTVEQLRSCFPQAQVTLVLGADSFNSLPQWYEPQKLALLADFLVIRRAGEIPGIAPQLAGVELRFRYLENPLWDVSSSLLREWLHDYYLAQEQRDFYLQEWVASLLREKLGDAVFMAIVKHGWYCSNSGPLYGSSNKLSNLGNL